MDILGGGRKAGNAGQDLVSGFRPNKQFGLVVGGLDKVIDVLVEF